MSNFELTGIGRAMLERAEPVTAVRAHIASYWGVADGKSLTRVSILGAAEEGRRLAAICRERGIMVNQIVDDHPERKGTNISGIEVKSVKELEVTDRAQPIVLATHQLLSPMRRLRTAGYSRVIPFAALEAVAEERFPPHMFYEHWCAEIAKHREEILALYDCFADRKSIKVLDHVLDFRLTFDPEAIAGVIEPQYYFPEDLIRFGVDEVFVDGGAYDGDTIETFSRLTGDRFERIFAFEPDRRTHKRLMTRFAEDARIETIGKGLYDHTTELYFHNLGTRGSVLVDNAEQGIRVEVTSIDEVLAGGRASYIKMNIEGAELAALEGAAETIRRHAPKLAIAAYHRPSDLWEIPNRILSISPNYRLYLRQHGYGVIETVVHAIPNA
jgi:FkbM family methyltransferase